MKLKKLNIMKYLLICFLLVVSIVYAQKDLTHVALQELTDLKIDKSVRNEMANILKMYGSIVALVVAILVFLGFRSYNDFKNMIKSDLEKSITDQINEKYLAKFQSTTKQLEILNLKSQLNEFKIRFNAPASDEKDKTKILESVKKLIESVKDTKDTNLVVQYLEFIVSLHFSLGEYEDISSLIRKYGREYQLSYITWANNAIANTDLYELWRSST